MIIPTNFEADIIISHQVTAWLLLIRFVSLTIDLLTMRVT